MKLPTTVPFRRVMMIAPVLLLCLAAVTAVAQGPFTATPKEPPMMKGDGWSVETIFTVSETIGGYQPVGILDGIAVYPLFGNRARVLVNHELNPGNGYAYSLANGTQLTGARVSNFVIQRLPNGETVIESAELAFDTIYDRSGTEVTDPAQLNETANAIDGFARFCSSAGWQAGEFGFVDDVYFTGEETSKPFHPHGGTEWVIDVDNKDIWAVPALGRGAWENVTALDTGDPSKIALLLGDDSQSAPLYLYIGDKNGVGDMSFLDRNGLKQGQLYVWVADNGDLDPQAFNGEGSSRTGTFQPIAVQDIAMAGMPGHDAAGYRDGDTMRAAADAMGAFSFSRPEDLHTNPVDGTQVVFASTGRGALFPADNWGTTYIVDVDFSGMPVPTGNLTIIHDADGLTVPDEGIRSPDNLCWADNGLIYIQEDRSTSPSSLFGGVTGIEASLWQLDPNTLERKRIATVDRSVVRPVGATDIGVGSIGNWETSGVLDVTSVFDTKPGEILLIAAVQAHGIRDGAIGDNPLLDEGGQLVFVRKEAVMLRGDTAATGNGWTSEEIFTVSETFGNYQPPGILDGTAAYPAFGNRAEVLVNHELNPGNGYAYSLANGTQLTGARVSRFIVNRAPGGNNIVEAAGLAYDTVYDRNGMIVTDPAQINETGNAIDGFARFCSSAGYRAGEYGFVDDLYFTGEETSKPFHPHGGTEWVIDVDGQAIWAAPALGRGAWENVTALETGDPTTVALLLGDDVQSAPLYLYVGQKNGVGDMSFLDRNGLKMGQVYVWVADNGDLDPQAFNGAGSTRTGTFQPIAIQDVSMAGMTGYDANGYLDGDTLRAAADAMGAFSFSRPEDLHTNPADGTQAVFASTGRGALFPADNWGTVYLVNVTFNAGNPICNLEIIHDADGLAVPDEGIRSPDNLVWASNGMIYIQEDRSTSPGSLFGGVTGVEASLWQLNPNTGDILRVAEVDRSVVRPLNATDIGAGSIGNWETSGVIDVTDLFNTAPQETLLLATVQAHGIRDGAIGDNPLLDEGGQLVFLRSEGFSHTLTCRNNPGNGVTFGFEVKNGVPGRQYLFAATAVNVGSAPDGWFFGIDIALFELTSFFNAPFLGTLDGNGRAKFDFQLAGANCPLGIALDCVAVEFAGPGIVSRSSRATTVNL